MATGVELRKAVIKNADMSEEMQADAVDCATQALEKYNIEKDIAAYIKKEFDKKYNPTWHCIVGRKCERAPPRRAAAARRCTPPPLRRAAAPQPTPRCAARAPAARTPRWPAGGLRRSAAGAAAGAQGARSSRVRSRARACRHLTLPRPRRPRPTPRAASAPT
jgi:hypothetical protein